MNRKLTMALVLAGVFTAPMTAAYAEGTTEWKPVQIRSIAAEDDKKESPKPKDPKPQIIAEDDKKESPKPKSGKSA